MWFLLVLLLSMILIKIDAGWIMWTVFAGFAVAAVVGELALIIKRVMA